MSQLPYRDILTTYPDMTTYYDAAAHASYGYSPLSKAFVSFDTPAVLSEKTKWAAGQGLGGIMIWVLQSDTVDAELIKALSGGGIYTTTHAASATTTTTSLTTTTSTTTPYVQTTTTTPTTTATTTTTTTTTSRTTTQAPVATNGSGGRCGPTQANAVCIPTLCCSSQGWCGATNNYCNVSEGKCLIGYGMCWPATTTTTKITTTTTNVPTTTTKPTTTTTRTTTTSRTPTPTPRRVGSGARCGPSYNAICTTGLCCSRVSYCGAGSAWCGTGCQIGWGGCWR